MVCARAVGLVALTLLGLAAADTKHCYYPDGTLADAGTSPCNTTAAVSACCDPHDSCTSSGLCLGASGWIYRSSCTDQTWTSSTCPSQCHTDPILNTPYSSYASIYPCVAGLYPTEFCCGSYSNKDCCGSNFTLGNTGLAFKPGTDAVQAQISSLSASLASATSASSQATVTTTATATATATATSSSSNNLGAAIGAGVGIPLGLLAIGLLGFLVWRERRRHRDLVAAGQGSSVGWSHPTTMSPGQYGGASSAFTSTNPGYDGGNPGWGGATAPMSQHGTAQGPMGGQYAGNPPLHQEQPGWKDPNAPPALPALPALPAPSSEVQGHPINVMHELQT